MGFYTNTLGENNQPNETYCHTLNCQSPGPAYEHLVSSDGFYANNKAKATLPIVYAIGAIQLRRHICGRAAPNARALHRRAPSHKIDIESGLIVSSASHRTSRLIVLEMIGRYNFNKSGWRSRAQRAA